MLHAASPPATAHPGAARLRSTRRAVQRRPARCVASSQELCCIVDEDNNVVGAEPRAKTVRECVASVSAAALV